MNNLNSDFLFSESEYEFLTEKSGAFLADGYSVEESDTKALDLILENRNPKEANNSCKKINRIFDFILEKSTHIIVKNPLYKFLPNDIEQCAAFVQYFSRYVKHNKANGFLVYDNAQGKWLRGEIAEVIVKKLVEWLAKQRWDFREVLDDQNAKSYAKEAQSARSVIRIFQTLEGAGGLKAIPEEFDKEKHMINMFGIAVDLKTGKQRPAEPEDMFTKSTSYKPFDNYEKASTSCSVFKKFIREISCERKDLIDYLMTFLGYSLTGEMKEQKALFILGLTAGNGKGTLLTLLKTLLGDYCIEMPNSIIFQTRNEGRFDFAELEGARLAVKSDSTKGAKINTGNFKIITGGDSKLPAERKFRDTFYFSPICKLIICCNNKPGLPETGGAMERRIALIPFDADFKPKPDKHLPEKLLCEASVILTVLIERAGVWYEKGLPESPTVASKTREYILNEDELAEFITDKCTIGEKLRVDRVTMFDTFKNWSVNEKLKKGQFYEMMEAKGYKARQSGEESTKGKWCFFGIGLKEI